MMPVFNNSAPCEPLGWRSLKYNQRSFRTILPSDRRGCHATMHRNIPDFLRPKPHTNAQYCQDPEMEDLLQVLRLIQAQRMPTWNFSGSKIKIYGRSDFLNHSAERLNTVPVRRDPTPVVMPSPKYSSEQVKSITQRLAAYDKERYPPESKGTRPGTPEPLPELVFGSQKRSKAEVELLVKRLAEYDSTKGPPDSRGFIPEQPTSSEMRASKPLSAEEVERVTTRLTKYDAARWPPESRYGPTPLLPKREGIPASKVEQIVDRLIQYNSKRWPPESYGDEWKQEPKKKPKVSKEITERAQQIVEKLIKFDPTRWPPESKGTKQPVS